VKPVCDDGMYFNALACQCFSPIKCMLMCPESQDLHPARGCDCVSKEEIRDLYPDWATDEDINQSNIDGMNDFFNKEPPIPEPEPEPRMKRPDHWPTCKETIECKEGTWLNELACMCMQEYQCNIVCPAKQVMNPWKGGCGCIEEEKLMDSFPDWVT